MTRPTRRLLLGALLVLGTAGALGALVAARHAEGWAPGRFSRHVAVSKAGRLPFQAWVPASYDPARRWPVVLFMHGGGSRGTDNELQMQGCLADLVRRRPADIPAIVLFPQAPYEGTLARSELRDLLTATIDSAQAALSVDADRVALSGFSMGGGLGYELAWQDVHRYSGLLVVSAAIPAVTWTEDRNAPIGVVDTLVGRELRDLPTWVMHGARDPIVKIEWIRAMIGAFRVAGMRALRYTEDPAGAHSCAAAFATPDALAWLVAQRRPPAAR